MPDSAARGSEVVSHAPGLVEDLMMNGDIVGTWRLVSWELHDESGSVQYPMGKFPVGQLTYTSDGYVSVVITGHDRRRLNAVKRTANVPEQTIAVARRSLSYAGTYECEDGAVIHHVELSSLPNWVGTDQERRIDWQGGNLILYTDPSTVGREEQAAYLTWERLPPSLRQQ